MTFQEWVAQRTAPGQRRGQFLFNTLPDHLATYVGGDLLLDPFHAKDEYDVRFLRFMQFCELAWDCTTEEDLKAARTLIWKEYY